MGDIYPGWRQSVYTPTQGKKRGPAQWRVNNIGENVQYNTYMSPNGKIARQSLVGYDNPQKVWVRESECLPPYDPEPRYTPPAPGPLAHPTREMLPLPAGAAPVPNPQLTPSLEELTQRIPQKRTQIDSTPAHAEQYLRELARLPPWAVYSLNQLAQPSGRTGLPWDVV